MKLINESLAGRTISTSLGQFSIEKDGTLEVESEIGMKLLEREGWAGIEEEKEEEKELEPELTIKDVQVPHIPKQKEQPRFKRNK